MLDEVISNCFTHKLFTVDNCSNKQEPKHPLRATWNTWKIDGNELFV